MRQLPADFAQKVEDYVRTGAALIQEHKIPPPLVMGVDETNSQFVSEANRTRDEEGAKRVRLLGVGHEKAQITTTLGLTEDGKHLPVQYIWAGKTNR